nr:MAG TPA: hypothetical protein [Bacteriophage sp.]
MRQCILVVSRLLVAILAIQEAARSQNMLYLLQELYRH